MGNNKVRPLLTILSLLIYIGISFGNNIQNREKEYIFEGIWNPDSVEIDNGYFRVMQNSTYCNSANTPGFETRIIVALDKIKFTSSTGKKSWNVEMWPFFLLVNRTGHQKEIILKWLLKPIHPFNRLISGSNPLK